jgi:tryptophan synthase alpha chain
MSRIASVFAELHRQGRTALVPYVTAGDPNPAVTLPLLHALVAAGADIIELGVPFSDPMADGPVIQRASERALVHGVSLTDCLDLVRRFRIEDDRTPIVLMGYLNPVEVMGYGQFAARARDAGVDGALIVDLPPEEADDMAAAMTANGVDLIYLVAPTSTPERIQRICERASGFVYYVAVKGVTGAAHLDVAAVAERLDLIRRVTRLPLGVGFGIKDPDTAARMAQIADAVVVGSALVQRIEQAQDQPDQIPARIGAFVGTLRAAIDAVDGSRP